MAEPQAPAVSPVGESALRGLLKQPIAVYQSAIIGLHDALGIPWWATVVGAGICARALTLPLSLRAAAAGSNFLRARTAIEASTFSLLGDAGFAACTPALSPHAQRLPHLTYQLARKPYSKTWLIAPIAQVPLLAVGTLSFMSLQHPALAIEGCLWFPDLTRVPLSYEGVWNVVFKGDVYVTNQDPAALRDAIAPMGVYGVICPTLFYLTWRDNLSNSMRTISRFFYNTFAKSSFETGVRGGRSRAEVAIDKNVKVSQVMTAFMYPFMLTVPTVGMLYLFSSGATAWLTFRLLPLLQARRSPPSASTPPSSASTTFNSSQASNSEDSGSQSQLESPQDTERAPATSASGSGGMATKGAATRGGGGAGPGDPTAVVIVTATASPMEELQSSTDVEKLLDDCVVQHAKKRTRLALVAAQRAQQLQPQHARISFAVAQLHRSLRHWKAAIQQLDCSLLLEPAANTAHRARVLAIKSMCLLELRRPAEALQAATAAVALQPDEAMHWVAKMNALRSGGQIGAAIADAKRVAELDPDLGRDLPEVLEKLQASRAATGPTPSHTRGHVGR